MSRTFSFWFQVLRNWLRYLIYLKNNQYKNCQKNHISTVCIAWKSALDEFFCLGLFPAEPKGEFYIFEYIVSLLQKLQCQLGSYLVIDMKSIMGCISFQLLMFLLTTHTHTMPQRHSDCGSTLYHGKATAVYYSSITVKIGFIAKQYSWDAQ